MKRTLKNPHQVNWITTKLNNVGVASGHTHLITSIKVNESIGYCALIINMDIKANFKH